jgi:DNA-directed RNA polymerase specialized sigma24 family protein
MSQAPTPASSPDVFPHTLWSMVRLAVAEGKAGADKALDDLCRTYEKPILIYILRSGHSPEAAQDLKQAFFEHLLAKNAFADAESTKVKLRAFLITKLQSFLIDRHRHAAAAKRGAGRVANMADLSETQALRAEPVDEMTPIIAFQRQWMDTLATNAMQALRADYTQRGHSDLFTALAPFITGKSETSLATLAAQLGRPEGTLKSDISRLRAKCQNLIRDQIATTLDDPTPENITAELREIMGTRSKPT